VHAHHLALNVQIFAAFYLLNLEDRIFLQFYIFTKIDTSLCFNNNEKYRSLHFSMYKNDLIYNFCIYIYIKLIYLIKVRCTPKPLCTAEQSMHKNIPYVTDAHVGFDA